MFIHNILQILWMLRTWGLAMAFFSSSVNGDLSSHGRGRKRKLGLTYGKSCPWWTRILRNRVPCEVELDVAWIWRTVWQASVELGQVTQETGWAAGPGLVDQICHQAWARAGQGATPQGRWNFGEVPQPDLFSAFAGEKSPVTCDNRSPSGVFPGSGIFVAKTGRFQQTRTVDHPAQWVLPWDQILL